MTFILVLILSIVVGILALKIVIRARTTSKQEKVHVLQSERRTDTVPVPRNKNPWKRLGEFVSVFGCNAHNVLKQCRKTYGPVCEFSGMGQKLVFLFDYKDLSLLKQAEGK